MSIPKKKCEKNRYRQSLPLNIVRDRLCRMARLIAVTALAGAAICSTLCAQKSNNDPGAPNMSGVTDVTPGWKYILQNKDLAMVQVTQNADNTVTTSLLVMDTSKSSLSGTQQSVTIDNFSPGSIQGTLASQASGRIFNNNTDTVAVLSAIPNGWKVYFADSNAVKSSSPLKSSFSPTGTVYTQVVMGDFNGDGLADPLTFYTATNFNGSDEVRWGMVAITAAAPTKPWDFTTGPELGGDTTKLTAPVAGTIVVGDFNGDGRDEIAALLDDYQTIAFYSVDPTSLAITQITSVKLSAEIPTVGNFPLLMTSGQVALAAGKFRQCGGNGTPCQANGTTNADVVVFGQISQINGNAAAGGYSVIPIKISPNPGGTPTFTATIIPMKNPTQDQPFFRFPDRPSSNGALAQAAPLAYWPQQTDEQLVLGIKCSGDYAASYIEIGSFLPDDGALDTFDWESETEREYNLQSDHLENMWVGNFDHQNEDGSHNAGWQIETYELVGVVNNYYPHILIFNINVPSPFPSNPPKTTDWLSQQSDNTSNIPFANPDSPSLGFLAPSDMQGRSLRLGAPTIVRIPTQTQPDLVLAIPPMHVDYIAPHDLTLASLNGCSKNINAPCVVNLSVIPSEPPSQGQGFATSFNFTSSANNSSKRSMTTSWGVSTKIAVGESSTFNDGLENATESLKDTTKAGHDGTVKKTYGSYTGMTQSLNATTGLSDYLYFTQKAMNVYYYPVLGCDAAGASNCWIDGKKIPLYVQFSVPDQVRYSDVDGLKQDWYQPVHEAGNVLSYPWSFAQLQGRYAEQVNSLTGPATCMATGTSSSSYSTQWTAGHNQDSSSGSTNSFSNELSMSYSEGAGVKGVDAADFNFSMDIAASTSLNTLNESSTSMSTSKAISVHIPQFGYAAKCCGYAFGGYVYGLKNKNNPASENACTAGQTPDKDGCTAVNDPDTGKPIDIAGTGPMFAGFLADPISTVNTPNTDLTCSGSDIWWQKVYTAPDIALNHPGRWNWDKAKRQVSFVTADSTPTIEDNYFYLMKGFFISKKGNTNGPNLAEASPSDSLTLSARVYNYSLANTTGSIHVRFYGQLYCTSSGSGENSCKSGNTTCEPGLCGPSFLIGEDSKIQSISGFKANGNEPNWALAQVDFEPGKFITGNAYMVFWVVAWMQDGNTLVTEMPGHGLASIPRSNLTQITQVPIQPYSNNVGMYGVHQHFYICPASGCESQQTIGSVPTSSTGLLKTITISVDPKILLEQRSKVSTTLRAAGGPIGPVNIAYYDGDPAKGGTLLDVQQIQHMDAGATYAHRSFFTPETCGTHTLYASAWTAYSPEVQTHSSTRVGIDSIDFARTLVDSTQAANITDRRFGRNLLDLLNTALQYFRQDQTSAGDTALSAYIQQLALANEQQISPDSAGQLTGQASVLLGCGATDFSLLSSPSSAILSTHSPASYAIAVTPIGNFTGKISLACIGAPKGVDCTFSSRSVTLDGSSQSHVTLTVTADGSGDCISTTETAQTDDFEGRHCSSGAGWHKRPRRLTPGTYFFILRANSATTVRDTPLTLVVR